MKKEGKSKYVGLRLTEEQDKTLSQMKKNSDLTKSEILIKGLTLLEEYRSLGFGEPDLNLEIKNLEREAKYHTDALKEVRKKEEAVRQMIQELSNVEAVVDKYNGQKSALIQILLDLQAQNHWLPKTTLTWVAQRLQVPMNQIYHVTTFYKAFSLVPLGRHSIQSCLGTACQVRGAPRLLDRLVERLKIKPGETSPDQRFTLTTVNCLGCCALGPVMTVDGKYYSNPSNKEIEQILTSYA